MTLAECIIQSAENKELTEQFNRLTGHKLGTTEFAGKNDVEAFEDFCQFVIKYIWKPMCEEDEDFN